MNLCNTPPIPVGDPIPPSFWSIYSDRYFNLSGAVGGLIRIGGPKSNYKIDTTVGVSSIALPRIDANPKRDPKDGDVLTFIDAEDTWATNNVTFLAGDNFIWWNIRLRGKR